MLSSGLLVVSVMFLDAGPDLIENRLVLVVEVDFVAVLVLTAENLPIPA